MPKPLLARRSGGALVLSVALLASLQLSGPTAPAASGAVVSPDGSSTAQPRVVRDGRGQVRLLGARPGRVLAAAPAGSRGVAAARAHARRFGARLGLPASSGLRLARVSATASGHQVVRLQQTVDGVPVLGGQLVTVLDRSSALLSIGGEAASKPRTMAYDLPASAAARTAVRVTAAAHGLRRGALQAARPTRWIYDAALLDPRGTAGGRAVWRVEVTATARPDIRELVLVDAGTGAVLLRVDQVAHVTDRVVCDRAGVPSADVACRPGQYARVEGSAPTGIPDVDQAYDLTGATSEWFATRLGVDLTAMIGSDLGDGRKLRSTTRYCPAEGCPFDNAFWTGDQMVYGAGFASADDVVAHELSHGLTQHTAGLVYWYQSGAINESMSDVLGELVDLTDGIGTDTTETRWQLGEDLTERAGGITRDMADPTLHGQPDHTGSDLYDFAPDYDDNGGVHTNSGVPNKTAYLVVDGTAGEPGGAFNGQSFAGIGTDKAALLYWSTLQMLTPGADFTDLAAVLQQACANLAAAGTAGVTAVDCQSVAAATTATGLTRWAGPSVPQAVTMTGRPRSVHLTWRPPTSAGSSPLNSYVVHVRPAIGEDDFFPVEPSAREFLLEDLVAGTDYTVGLVAVTADGASPSVMRRFTASALQVTWPDSVRYGETLRIRGTLRGSGGAPAGDRTVRLLRRYPGSSRYERVAAATTAADGTFSLPTRPSRRAAYHVTYAGSAHAVGARSASRVVAVRQRVRLSVDPHVSLGQVATFHGAVTPARPGALVRLQRQSADGSWRTVVRGRLTGASRYDLAVRVTGRRTGTWRVVVPPLRSAGLAAGLSREVAVPTSARD